MASAAYKRQTAKVKAIEKSVTGERIVITGKPHEKMPIAPWPRATRKPGQLEPSGPNINDIKNG